MYNSTDVTIIIPVCCKTQESLGWLEECLQSAVSQGCEVVAHDDGSTVNTHDILSKYIKRYSYSVVNLGVSNARNQCVKLVRTSQIFPLDCDDRLKPDSIASLVKVWNGVPVYPDLAKFGQVNDPHYKLMEFHCDHITTYVGFSSVNVLHSLEQNKAIGGWDETIDFYEDGEYNARLFAMYCGQRHAEPLVEYRIHANQRTKHYGKLAAEYAARILVKIRSLDMACSSCGKRRTGPGNDPSAGVNSMLQNSMQRGPITSVLIGESYKNMPIDFEGKVLAVYVGGEGKAKHYYQGQGSKFSHRVQYGDHLYVDPRDAREFEATSDTRMLVRVKPRATVPQPVIVVEQPKPAETSKAPAPIRLVPEIPKVVYDLPDIANMTKGDVLQYDWGGIDIPACIRMEARGKNRKGIIEFLKLKIQGANVNTD